MKHPAQRLTNWSYWHCATLAADQAPGWPEWPHCQGQAGTWRGGRAEGGGKGRGAREAAKCRAVSSSFHSFSFLSGEEKARSSLRSICWHLSFYFQQEKRKGKIFLDFLYKIKVFAHVQERNGQHMQDGNAWQQISEPARPGLEPQFHYTPAVALPS